MRGDAPAAGIKLRGDLELTDETGVHRAHTSLLGDGNSALVRAGILPDPYFGRTSINARPPALLGRCISGPTLMTQGSHFATSTARPTTEGR